MVNKKKNRKDAHSPQRAVHSLGNISNLRIAVLLEWQQKCSFMQDLVCTSLLGNLRLPNKKWQHDVKINFHSQKKKKVDTHQELLVVCGRFF